MSKALVAAVLCAAVLSTSGLVLAVTVISIRLKTGRSLESILTEPGKLFRRSVLIAIVLLVLAAAGLVISNNQ